MKSTGVTTAMARVRCAGQIITITVTDRGRLRFAGRPVAAPSAGKVYARIDQIRAAWIVACRDGGVRDLPARLRPAAGAAAAARRARRALGYGSVQSEPSFHARIERRVSQHIASLYQRAAFRVATHGHHSTVHLVPRGGERAESGTSRARPAAVGLPAAYARKGFEVVLSRHDLYASVASLGEARVERRRVLWLTRTVRVVQSRGTALRVERVRRGAREVWT